MKLFLLFLFPVLLFAVDMNIPTIYTQNVGVLFSVVISFFVAVFGVVKTIKAFKELHK